MHLFLIILFFCITANAQETKTLPVANFLDGETISYNLPRLKGVVPDIDEGVIEATNELGEVTHWPIYQHRYKILVKLKLGDNNLKFKVKNKEYSFHLKFSPPNNIHKVKVIYYLGSDGDGALDAPPGVANGIDEALKRIKLDALMLQSFFAESYKSSREAMLDEPRLSRKTFYFDLDENGDPKVDIVRHYSKTRAELLARNSDYQDFQDFTWMINNQDSWLSKNKQWDPATTVHMVRSGISHLDPVTGKYASGIGLGSGGIEGGGVGINEAANLITHAPTLEDVDSYFTNTKLFDPKYIIEDSYLRGNYWGSYTATLGGMMHELGHGFSLGHTTMGVMASDASIAINRFFSVYEIKPDGKKFAITNNNEIRDNNSRRLWWPTKNIDILERSPYIY